jgi:nucleoside-diphosphate-sugar epimerase
LKALVTGGTGFTGSNLVNKLAGRGYEVRVLARKTSNIEVIKSSGIEIMYGDITDREKVFKSVNGMDWVFNVAAAYRQANLTDKDFKDVNLNGTRNIIAACLKYNTKRLVHCSTIGVVTSVKNPPGDETTQVSPGDAYQDSKWDAESEVLKAVRKQKLPASVIRPCAIYGPGDMRLLKMFKMIANKRFVFFGNGQAYYHMIYIDDLTDAFILAATNEEAIGEVFIIGDERYITLNELAESIAKEFDVPPPKIHLPYRFFEIIAAAVEFIYKKLKLKKEPPIYRRRMAFFKKNRAFSIEKAKRVLGFEPRVNLEKGIHLTAEWYRQKGFV